MLTEDEKKDPENGEKAINVLQWLANTEEESKSGVEHMTHFIMEDAITLPSDQESYSQNGLMQILAVQTFYGSSFLMFCAIKHYFDVMTDITVTFCCQSQH